MRCPRCGFEFKDDLSAAAAAMGRKGKGKAKARDPAKQREYGRLGGLKKAENAKRRAAKEKKQPKG